MSAAIKKLIKRQKALHIQLTAAISSHEQINIPTLGYYQAKIEIIGNYWKEFSDNHLSICEEYENTEDPYFTQTLFETTEKLYIKLLTLLKDGLNQCPLTANRESNHSHTNTSDIKLPRIDIPKFDGNYKSWRPFYDLFRSLIHEDQSLSNIQRLHYLKTSVTSEAERMLRQFDITSSNYEKAWDLLIKRYDNKRVLASTQLKLLLNQQQIKFESPTAIKNLLTQTEESLHELKTLNLPIQQWDTILIHLLVLKLPSETHYLWEQEISSTNDFPTYTKFIEFLEKRFRTLEAMSSVSQQGTYKPFNSAQYNTKPIPKTAYGLHNNSTNANRNMPPCIMCKALHMLFYCPKFRVLNVHDRLKYVKENKACINCLAKTHTASNCPSKKRCFECKKLHNTLLHYQLKSETEQKQPVNGHTNTVSEISDTLPSQPNAFFNSNFKKALLSTAIIEVINSKGTTDMLRVLIDSGSQVSFITESAYKRLKLRGSPIDLQISGLANTHTASAHKYSSLTIKSLNKEFSINVEALVISKISGIMPHNTIDIHDWKYIQNLQLADPQFYKPGPIDMLLGADIYAQIITNGIIKGPSDTPVAQNTHLGWILIGKMPETSTYKISNLTASVNDNMALQKQIKKFWETEEIPNQPILSPMHEKCEDFYKNNHIRLDDGKYEVKLPFIDSNSPDLGHSRNMALRQFQQLEQRFQKNPQYFEMYKSCIEEYIALGHMKLLPTEQVRIEQNNKDKINYYYLPHHAVMKESSTTKMRVVFNASSKTSNGKSLNEQLLVGPTIQPTLWTILLRWRQYKYAISADIEKMYRMINIYHHHQNYQRIIWRSSPDKPIQDFVLTTVTFGTAPAPYLAIRTIQQLAMDEKDNYPLAFESIKRDFYVDDLLSGTHTLSNGVQLQTELLNMFQRGGFNLRKWASSHPLLLEQIPESDREIKNTLNLSENESIKTLGIYWHPVTDCFSFAVTLPSPLNQYTKRIIISEISTLFDPLGWLAPAIIKAKILIQKLWLSGCDWDEEVPVKLATEWITFKSQLLELRKLKIPRWTHFTPNAQSIEIHGFCDASTNAYAAVIYLKIIQEDIIDTQLITSKTRVAPTKCISLPRLELCGAVLLSQLLHQVQHDLNLQNIPIFAWTDSTITLAWIQSHPSKWKTYIGNRVSEIHTNLPDAKWNHISSKSNPADAASRGVLPGQLIDLEIWWHGPSWFQQAKELWPKQSKSFNTDLEKRKIESFASTCETGELVLLNKFSTFTRTIRVMAYCLRFINNCQEPKEKRCYNINLSLSEIDIGRCAVIKLTQIQAFQREINLLKANKPIHNKSPILSLHPFLDNQGMLRVGGRLSQANINYDQKHPIILPNKNHISNILIDNMHKITLHGGTQLVLSTLRANFWILNARNTIRSRIKNCIICKRYNATTSDQLMSSLPSARVTQSLPFIHTGVDYAGPIELKTANIKSAKIIKAYICIFICLSTKAIHIELVTELSTSAFLAAFRRFIGRRGLCSHMYSDQGTNFIGANKALQNDFKDAIKSLEIDIANEFANLGIKWHFNPPSAPHFGGLWEAGVKSIKRHLYKIINSARLTYEEMSTILIQIEACLNSRPLYPISNDPNDSSYLTPGHFLTGKHLLTPIEASLPDIPYHSVKRWQYLRVLTNSFWKKWSTDYLNELQIRNKWQKEKRIPLKNSIVIIKEDNLPPGQWVLGRVLDTHRGHDNLIRAVTLKTSKNILTRPLTKIIPLLEEN